MLYTGRQEAFVTMRPQLTTREGNVIPLTDEMYEAILEIVKERSDLAGSAASIEELEDEFSELFAHSATTDDLLNEHRRELAREQLKLERID